MHAGQVKDPAELRTVRADDAALTWSGAVEVEHTADWSRAWRLPLSRLALFPGERLQERARMQAGVRITFGTDAVVVGGRLLTSTPEVLAPVDLVVDGHPASSLPVVPDGTFRSDPLPPGAKSVQVWLPQFGDVRLAGIHVNAGAEVWEEASAERPRLVTYGSSITQCRTAASPSRTWPALVAAELGMDLTCLGFGGECHLDPMIARMIRDMPAEVITTCLGINVHGNGTFTDRSFLPAVLGFLSTVRDGHPGVPILVISPIVSPSREETAGGGRMSLREIRAQVGEAVELLRADGDAHIHLLNGLDVFGPAHAHLLGDGLHPDADGYAHMAASITPAVRTLVRPSSTSTPLAGSEADFLPPG